MYTLHTAALARLLPLTTGPARGCDWTCKFKAGYAHPGAHSLLSAGALSTFAFFAMIVLLVASVLWSLFGRRSSSR